jgi:hypothetical protein
MHPKTIPPLGMYAIVIRIIIIFQLQICLKQVTHFIIIIKNIIYSQTYASYFKNKFLHISLVWLGIKEMPLT